MSLAGEKSVQGHVGIPDKELALNLIDQIIQLEKLDDLSHVKLLAEKKIYRNGDSAVTHHLKVLKEIVERL